MGADFLVQYLYIQKDKTPDWNAGKQALVGLEESDDHGPIPVEQDILDLEGAFVGNFRDAVTVEIGEYKVVLSGGMSWGDSPTDTYDSIERIANYPKVWQAMGFAG